MITFKDYLEHNHPEVLDEAWWHGALAGLGLMTGFAGGPSAQAASSGSPITTTIRNYKGDKEAPVILSQKFDKIYIGYTSDLIDRFMSHNKLSTKGFTANFRPWKVIYVEFIENKSMALTREKQLKSARGRIFCREQIVL